MVASTLRHWLALYYCLPLASRHFHTLLQVFGSPSEALSASPDMYARQGLPESFCASLRAWQAGHSRVHQLVEADLKWQDLAGQYILVPDDLNYPQLLRHIPDPPPVLFIKGSPHSLHDQQLAIVGSRKASSSGLAHTRRFAREVSQQGITVTSGLAFGIDSEAHRAALAAGGRTIAVLGGGVDEIYPRRHTDLAAEICGSGCLVSEFPRGFQPLPWCFPRRNRIVTGLSVGVLVVEAGLRSGSLISASSALEQGREVFAIPGSIDNPRKEGCHSLIRQGAILVESPQHVVEALSVFKALEDTGKEKAGAGKTPELTADETRVLAALEDIPCPAELLSPRTGMSPGQVLAVLTRLELHGLARAGPDGYEKKVVG